MLNKILYKTFLDHIDLANAVQIQLSPYIKKACILIGEALLRGNKILIIGNGGSASDAQHIAAEFTGRYSSERIPLPAIALTSNSSALTAIGNDYGYEQVFSRQIKAIGNKGDILLAISTSGNSLNILNALYNARLMGLNCICLTGKGGGKLKNKCEMNIVVPSQITARIQEMHILIGHIFCEYVDSLYSDCYESLKTANTEKTI